MTSLPHSTPPEPPWYRRYPEHSGRVSEYLDACRRIVPETSHSAQLDAYKHFSAIRLVFESNLIEGAGTSLGDTRKIIEDHFPQIPYTFDKFNNLNIPAGHAFHFSNGQLKDMYEAVRAAQKEGRRLIPSVTFAGKSRSYREVSQHYQAVWIGHALAYEYVMDVVAYNTRQKMEKAKTFPAGLSTLPSRFAAQVKHATSPPCFLSEANIRWLHKTMASSLLPKDCGVAPGEYRTDRRAVGLDVVFPAPELVAGAVRTFVPAANALAHKAMVGEMEPCLAAALLSYDFVMIHPFPDFNGRISRLLLSMLLLACGMPFSVTLRGDKKGRARYLRALQLANRGKIEPMAALVALRAVEGFLELEEVLARSGLRGLSSFSQGGQSRTKPTHGRSRKASRSGEA